MIDSRAGGGASLSCNKDEHRVARQVMSAWSKCSRDREDSHLDETDGRLERDEGRGRVMAICTGLS